MSMSRRTFLTGMAAATATGLGAPKTSHAGARPDSYATLIDLSLCDGCPDRDTPLCVSACRTINTHKFPDPDPLCRPGGLSRRYRDYRSACISR